MKSVLFIVCMAAIVSLASAGQEKCGPVSVAANVEVGGEELSLANLLAPGACPEMVRGASRVLMGKVPLAGSVRVLEGEALRARLQKLVEAASVQAREYGGIRVPPRVTVRRSGERASCAGIRQLLFQNFSGQAIECGAEGRIPKDTPVAWSTRVWDPISSTWAVSARCVNPSDCVPFLVRWKGDADVGQRNPARRERQSLSRSQVSGMDKASHRQQRPFLVRPGEPMTLVWDEVGIHLVAPAICLDRARAGEEVRARIGPGGRVVRATVVDAGTLRVKS